MLCGYGNNRIWHPGMDCGSSHGHYRSDARVEVTFRAGIYSARSPHQFGGCRHPRWYRPAGRRLWWVGCFSSIRTNRGKIHPGARYAVAGIASVVGGFAMNAAWLMTTRAIEGIGFILITVSAPALVRRLAPPAKVNAAMGWWGAFQGIALFFGVGISAVLL